MCGICGIIGFTDTESATAAIRKMTRSIGHRGPDGEGFWRSDQQPVAFGHKRLAIIDLTENAAQPFVSLDGRYVITYNGEVYNYLELRDECTRLGSSFRSHSDTEVIVESYRHWGIHAFKRFRGMWAFALYDSLMHEMVFCRDPFGIKPLYYGIKGGVLFFASEPKALRAADGSFSEIDEVTVSLFERYGYIDRGSWTFFRCISRFPQASYSLMDVGNTPPRVCPVAFWTPPGEPIRVGMREAAEEVRRLFIQSVGLHMRSDVPVGSCLSGGMDSSAIVCISSTLSKSTGSLNTFTTRYPDHREIDETLWAQRVIDCTHATPHFSHPTLASFLTDLDELVTCQDEPFGSTSIYAQYTVFRSISETPVKVVLDGQGSDEIFAGYHGLLDIFTHFLLLHGRFLSYFSEEMHMARLYGKQHVSQFLETVNFLKNRFRSSIRRLASSWRGPSPHFRSEIEERLHLLNPCYSSFEEYLTDMAMNTNLPELLRYEDRNSMAFSIESRVPFLDPELAGFVMALPSDYKIRHGTTKFILREAMKGIIPEDIRVRIDKLGFPAPERDWLKRGFGIDVDDAGSMKWRQLVVKTWKKTLENPILS